MTNEVNRRHRIDSLYNMIKNCTDKEIGTDKEKLITLFQMEFGYSRRIVLEYIDLLKKSKLIKEDIGGLWASAKETLKDLDIEMELNKIE